MPSTPKTLLFNPVALGVCMPTSYMSAAVDPWDLLICEIQLPITSTVANLQSAFRHSDPRSTKHKTCDTQLSPSLRIERGTVANHWTERTLFYLAAAEAREVDPWARDDYRVAWLTVLRCSENVADAWRYSFWTYYGVVPEKAIPYWQERTASRDKLLGLDFAATANLSGKASRAANGAELETAVRPTPIAGSLGDPAPLTLPPKKPVDSVILAEKADAQ